MGPVISFLENNFIKGPPTKKTIINEVMREIMEFNNKVGYEYMYFPQLSRLLSEGIQQANTTYRNLKTDKKTKQLKDKMRESLNIKD